MRNWIPVLTAAALTLWIAQPSSAQTLGRPTVSPYLNLAQPFGNPALNYYNLVRPQVTFRAAIQQLDQNVTAEQAAFADLQAGRTNDYPITGHTVGFQTQQRYFGTVGLGRVIQGGAQPVGAAAARPKAPVGNRAASPYR